VTATAGQAEAGSAANSRIMGLWPSLVPLLDASVVFVSQPPSHYIWGKGKIPYLTLLRGGRMLEWKNMHSLENMWLCTACQTNSDLIKSRHNSDVVRLVRWTRSHF
jgi:hypothetical protein